MAQDDDGSLTCSVSGPFDLSGVAFVGQCLLLGAIQLRAFSGKPRSIGPGDSLLNGLLDGLASIGEHAFRHQAINLSEGLLIDRDRDFHFGHGRSLFIR